MTNTTPPRGAFFVAYRTLKAVGIRSIACARAPIADAALALIAVASLAAATTGSTGVVRAWYYGGGEYGTPGGYGSQPTYGAPIELQVPSDLGRCVKVAAGAGHFAALTEIGQVRAWGRNDMNQAQVPADLGQCTAIALGGTHSMAITKFGSIRAWGNNASGQCQVPFGLGQYTAIAAGADHSLAIRTNGQVRAWGSNIDGQCAVPSDLGTCTRIAAGSVHSVALRSDGTVRAWGANGTSAPGSVRGQTDIDGLQGVRTIAAGGLASMAVLQGEKSVVGFGTLAGGCEVRLDESVPVFGFRAIALGDRALGLNLDSKVSGTGLTSDPYSGVFCSSGEQFRALAVPVSLGRCIEIASGQGNSVIVIEETDCNDDGIDDESQLDGFDCNQNGRLDACDADAGLIEDCDGNGLGDECDKQLSVELSSGRRGPLGQPGSIAWTIEGAVRALTPVFLDGAVRGDLSSISEYVRVKVGSTIVGTLTWTGSADCAVQPFQWHDWRYIDPAVFNNAITPAGTVTITFTPSVAVDPNLCTAGSWIEASIEYVGVAPSDCNGNGVLDTCEVADGITPDLNGNGRPDDCESALELCPADLTGDGMVNGADLGVLLAAWNQSGVVSADLNRDGAVNGADLGEMLSAWGPCAN
jgi:hypothetical protein